MPRRSSVAKKKTSLMVGDTVGASFGVTLNMGEYQSLRVEAWAETTKKEGETTRQTFARVFAICEEQANDKAAEYKR